jgi:tRNA dimethylallyltransferase
LKNKKLIIIAGPTASGKTDLAIKLALQLNTEIISADSRLVYRDFDIGTAKPSQKELNAVPHHLINIVNPDFNYTAAIFKEDATKIINQLHSENKIPVMAGGTGFYIRSAVDGLNMPDVKPDEDYRKELIDFAQIYGNQELHNKLKKIDPHAAAKIHYNDVFRITRALEVYKTTGQPMSELKTTSPSPYDLLYIALTAENRDFLYHRINQRVLTMLETGLMEEVKFLINKYGKTLSLLKTLGYKEVLDFLEQKCSYNNMIDDIQRNTRHFARRQLIWFRPDNRIHWYTIDTMTQDKILESILSKLENYDR